jgi:hypothetical protein
MDSLVKNRPFSISARAIDVKVSKEDLAVFLEDGRIISAPLEWFPRLIKATEDELMDWEFIGGGIGIHWEKLDEDISVRGLLESK